MFLMNIRMFFLDVKVPVNVRQCPIITIIDNHNNNDNDNDNNNNLPI